MLVEGLVSKFTCLLEKSLVDKNPMWSADRDSFLTSSLFDCFFFYLLLFLPNLLAPGFSRLELKDPLGELIQHSFTV